MPEPTTPPKKLCPFNKRECGPECACYIQLQKPIIITAGAITYPDPTTLQYYEGCGLIREIPWVTVTIKQETPIPAPATPETPEDKQAKEAYTKLSKEAKTQ